MHCQRNESKRTIVNFGKIMSKNYIFTRLKYVSVSLLKFSTSSVSRNILCGRDILQPEDLTVDDWKTFLWCAFDLKRSVEKRKECINIVSDKHVTLLFLKPSGRNLVSCSLACQITGAKSTFYSDPNFEFLQNFVDCGRALSQMTDLILVNGCNQEILFKLAEGSCAPVVALSSNMFFFIRALAFLMTIQERFGCLKRLKLAWIGPSTPLCNTILSVFPLFGINMKLCCICAHGSGQTTPVTYGSAIVACSKGLAEIHQSSSAAESAYRSHVIITSSHLDAGNKITNELIEEAELEWMFLHPLPRTDVEVSDDVFQHKNNLTWRACENHLYIAMAFIVSALTDYQPKIPMPPFDGS